MTQPTEQTLPHDIDAEEALLGSLLIGGQIDRVGLKPDDFYSEQNRLVYKACRSLADKGVGIDNITLCREMGGEMEAAGGLAYFPHLISICPTHLHREYYAGIIKQLSVRRQLIATAGRIATLGYETDSDVTVALTKADSMLLDLRKKSAPLEIITPEDRVKILADRYETLFNVPAGVAVPSGLRDLDRMLDGGFYGGDLVIVGARTSMGKTTLLQSIANNVGNRANILYFSGEMTMESLSDSDVAGKAGKPIGWVRSGNYEDREEGLYSNILLAVESLKDVRVFFVHGLLDTERIRQVSLSLQARQGLAAVVIDYMGLLTDEKGKNENQRLTYISRTLKQTAMELNVPVITAHQLNRAVEGREDKKPQLYDLRDSGSIEQDADVVLLLYRQNYYQKTSDMTTEIIIAKQRQGRSNVSIDVVFDEKRHKYADKVKEEKLL